MSLSRASSLILERRRHRRHWSIEGWWVRTGTPGNLEVFKDPWALLRISIASFASLVRIQKLFVARFLQIQWRLTPEGPRCISSRRRSKEQSALLIVKSMMQVRRPKSPRLSPLQLLEWVSSCLRHLHQIFVVWLLSSDRLSITRGVRCSVEIVGATHPREINSVLHSQI